MAESPSESILDRIPGPVRVALYMGLLLTAGYMVYSRIFMPLLADRSNLDTQIAALEPQIVRLETQIRSHLSVSQEERGVWARTQAQIEEKIPPDYRLADLIEQLSILAKKADLPDALITTSEKVALERPADAESSLQTLPSTMTNSAGLGLSGRTFQGVSRQEAPRRKPHITDIITAGYYPVTITFHGSFQNQGRFLADLAGLPQLIEVESLEVTREYPETAFRIVLRAYHTGKVSRV